MLTKQLFLSAGEEGFWSLTNSQIHTMVLRYGVIVNREVAEQAISLAKSTFFIFPKVHKRTGEYLVDLTIAVLKSEDLSNNVFNRG